MPGWNPWRALRSRPNVRLAYKQMHPSRGTIVDNGAGLRTITIDPRLDRIQRNATLAHELIHDEYDLLWSSDTPPEIVEKGERFVRCETADRLVPPHELEHFVRVRAEVGMVLARDVADEFDVPADVASLALDRLAAGL